MLSVVVAVSNVLIDFFAVIAMHMYVLRVQILSSSYFHRCRLVPPEYKLEESGIVHPLLCSIGVDGWGAEISLQERNLFWRKGGILNM